MNKAVDYIISLTHLYGLVHRDKVVEIYNMQNEEKIDEAIINKICKERIEELDDGFVVIYGDYFVEVSIIQFDKFEEQLMQRKGKPFYIPEQEELLKYKDDFYYEVTKEYKALLSYVTKNIFDGDECNSEMLCEEIQCICWFGFSMDSIAYAFNRRNINFKNEKQISEVMQLIVELANNTRIWENNGHTPTEIFELMEKPNLRPLPVGRNDSCPCGSGKKYKNCCLK